MRILRPPKRFFMYSGKVHTCNHFYTPPVKHFTLHWSPPQVMYEGV